MIERIEISKVDEAAARFMKYQYERVMDDSTSPSFYSDLVKSIEFVLSISIDGKLLKRHEMNIMTQQNKDELSDALLKGIQAEGKSRATA